MGDGSAGFHLAAFDTAVNRGRPFVAVVGNDARWNAEHQIQLRDHGAKRAHGCDLDPATRFYLAATGFGAHADRVETNVNLAPALTGALPAGRPARVGVLTRGLPSLRLRLPF